MLKNGNHFGSNISLDQDQSLVLRGIAIIMVVLYHSIQVYEDCLPSLFYVFRGLGALACSVFFFLSGYGFALKNNTTNKYWIKKIISIYIPFLLCNLIYFIYYTTQINTSTTTMSFVDIVIGLGRINPAGWFLQCLIIFYITLSLGKKVNEIIYLTIGGGIYTLLSHSVMTMSWICFPVGILFAKHSIKIGNTSFSIIFFFISYTIFLRNKNVNTIPLLINFLAMLLMFVMSFIRLKVSKSTFLYYLGKNSIDYYLIHFLILVVIKENFHPNIISFYCFILFTIVSSYIFGKVHNWMFEKLSNYI